MRVFIHVKKEESLENNPDKEKVTPDTKGEAAFGTKSA